MNKPDLLGLPDIVVTKIDEQPDVVIVHANQSELERPHCTCDRPQIYRHGQRSYSFEVLRAKALLRYGPFEKPFRYLDFVTQLRWHGIDLSTFEHDLAAGYL